MIKTIIKSIQLQPFVYLIGYYYSYSFLYECPYGKKIFKNSVFMFHKSK